MLIKVSAHFEMLKFGRSSDATYGIELSNAESRALFAVQKLLEGTDYRGNGATVRYPGYD